jgi:hypothetical protein
MPFLPEDEWFMTCGATLVQKIIGQYQIEIRPVRVGVWTYLGGLIGRDVEDLAEEQLGLI